MDVYLYSNMHLLEKSILEVFKKTNSKELTTSEIVKFVFPNETELLEASNFDEVLFIGGKKKALNSARYRKSLLHKRLLYHLNKLVDENILRISGIMEFGEKKFSIAQELDDLIIEDKKKTFVIQGSSNPSTPIDGYESKRVIKKFGSSNWIKKLDSIIIDSTKFELPNKFSDVLLSLFEEVSDVIALNNFEKFIQNISGNELFIFLDALSSNASSYGMNINFIIDVDEIFDIIKLKSFINEYIRLNNFNFEIIFEVLPNSFRKLNELFEFIIKEFSENSIKINIKNKNSVSAPLFYGNAGVYSFNEKEWKSYLKDYSENTLGLSCVSSSLVVDVKEFFKNYSGLHEFRNFILNANKALLISSVTKRKIFNNYFKTITKLNGSFSKEFFMCERTCLRFWNYNSAINEKESVFLSLLKNVKEESDNFSKNEETIYGSCGMPIRFKISFSSAFRKSDLTLTQKRYSKTTINDISYFESDENIKYLKFRQKLLKLFDNQDRVRFFRSSFEDNQDIINEFVFILQNFNMPLFTYDFSKIIGNTKLSSFFDKQ